MKTPAERGRFGRWLVAARQARSLNQREARAELSRAGIAIAPSVYAQYESGTKPISRTDLPKLVEFWGPIPEDEVPADLALAVRELRDELAALRQEREAWVQGWSAVLRAYAAGQVPTELLDALLPQPLEDARP